MERFNVGDRVRMIKKRAYSFDRVGMTGTIVEILPGMLLEIEVDGEEPTMDGGGWTYWVEDENWELIKEESKMAKFKIGDKVVIKDNKNFHRFQNGDVVVISAVHSDSYIGHKVGDDPEEWWAFEDSEIEEYKEEVRVQRIKVGDRVRMVNLRNDGLSYSFDKIGNEGIVKDVSSKFIQVDVHCKGNTWEGNGWTYPRECNCWEVIEEEPKMRVTSKVETMCIYSFDSVEDRKVFLKIADQDGFNVSMCEYGIEKYGSGTKFRVSNSEYISCGTYAYDVPEYPEYERVQFKVEEEKEMSKCKFKVGDLVKGNDPRRYIITNDKMVKAKVLQVYDCDCIRIKILEHLDEDYKNFAPDEFDVDPQYFDFYEESKKESTVTPKFKAGNKVKILDEIYGHGFNIGQIVEVTQVCYDEELLNGKNYNYECRSEDGEVWYLDDLEIELVQKEKPKTTVLKLDNYKIIFNGDTTVVTDGTRKGVAKRHPDDEYDAVVGLQVALERFHGGRKPKIGDKVRVLKVDGNSVYGRHSYSIGEIVTVINFAESDTDVYCKDRSSFGQRLIAGEYEVLG